MKHIVLLTPAHPLRGGIAFTGERLALELQRMGHRVEIYSFSLQYPDFLFPGKTQYSDDPAPGELHIKSAVNSVNPLNWAKVGSELRKLKPDLLICAFWLPFMGPSLGSILHLVQKNKHTRVVGLIHNIIPHEKRFGDRPFAQYFVNACDAFVTMSESVVEEMRLFTKTKPVAFSPLPLFDNYGEVVEAQAAKQQLGLAEDKEYALFFGFIRAYKGLDLLLHAMTDERIRELGIRLIVAGEFYSNEEEYRKLIEELNIADLLELRTQFISNEAIKYYFSAAQLVVQPYRSATQSAISQVAYHFERPMVVTNVGGLGETVEDGVAGYVVEVEAKAIADAIVDFFRNQRFDLLKKGVQERKKQFSWRRLAEATLSI